MRFSADLIFKGSSPYQVPTNYKKNIAVLFKDALKAADAHSLYGEFLSNKKQSRAKPFTYSVGIPQHEEIETNGKNLLEFHDPEIQIHVSSSDSKFIMNLYDGLHKINNEYRLFKYPSEFKNFDLEQERAISSDSILFKILSPVILRNTAVSAGKKKGKEFLCCKDREFRPFMADAILNLGKEFLPPGRLIRSTQIIVDSSKCSVTHVYHGNEIIPATTGYIHINAPKDVLKIIYDCGLGSMQSQGFGMVEVVG